MSQIKILKKDELDLLYFPNWLTKDISANIFTKLANLEYYTDEESAVVMFGKITKIPRKQIAFSTVNAVPYRFTGNSVAGTIWPDWLKDLTQLLNAKLREWEVISVDAPLLNFCLVNLYRDGKDYIGYHSDKTNDLIPTAQDEYIIVSLSFGATRRMLFSSRKTKKEYVITLTSGDLLIMRGKTNKYWKHAIAKDPDCDSPRISLTFRMMRETV
jgi:alkylated DNA repair dioxygenase AlkB